MPRQISKCDALKDNHAMHATIPKRPKEVDAHSKMVAVDLRAATLRRVNSRSEFGRDQNDRTTIPLPKYFEIEYDLSDLEAKSGEAHREPV